MSSQGDHILFDLARDETAKLKLIFSKDGIVAAASVSGSNDGEAAMVVMSAQRAVALGLKAPGKFVDYAVAGVEPNYMSEGPIPATKKLFQKSKYSLSNVGLIELNEAFAAQYMACERGMDSIAILQMSMEASKVWGIP